MRKSRWSVHALRLCPLITERILSQTRLNAKHNKAKQLANLLVPFQRPVDEMTKSLVELLRLQKLLNPNAQRVTVSAVAAEQQARLKLTGDAKTGRGGPLAPENIRSI